MTKIHHYQTQLQWTGNKGSGTDGYRSYDRSYHIFIENKPLLEGSSDPAFRGDPTKYNPEELLLASLSSCHMLWFLHLCAEAGVFVVAYSDQATAVMTETPDGGGRFTEVTLRPEVLVTLEETIDKVNGLHEKANKLCFIANSVNFPVRHRPTIRVAPPDVAKNS